MEHAIAETTGFSPSFGDDPVPKLSIFGRKNRVARVCQNSQSPTGRDIAGGHIAIPGQAHSCYNYGSFHPPKQPAHCWPRAKLWEASPTPIARRGNSAVAESRARDRFHKPVGPHPFHQMSTTPTRTPAGANTMRRQDVRNIAI